jgi:hypothetical protein
MNTKLNISVNILIDLDQYKEFSFIGSFHE